MLIVLLTRGSALSHVERLCTPDGRLSIEAVSIHAPSMVEPLTKGWRWCVIHRDIDIRVPELADFLQASHNSGAGTQKAHSGVQVLKSIHVKASAFMLANQKREEYEPKIVRSIEAAVPSIKGKIEPMIEFVFMYGGGTDGTFLDDLLVWCNSLSTQLRDIPSSMYKFLADCKLMSCVEYVYALVKACIVAPLKFCRGNECTKLFNAVDVKPVADTQSAKFHKAYTLDHWTNHRSMHGVNQ